MTDVHHICQEPVRFQLSRKADVENKLHTYKQFDNISSPSHIHISYYRHAYENRRLNVHLLQVTVKMLPEKRHSWCS